MFRILFGFLMIMTVLSSASANVVKVKHDNNWPDLKVGINNNWPDCKIKFEDNWPDVTVIEDNNWPDIKVKQDNNWPDFTVTEENNWPDVKVAGTKDLILAAVACPQAIRAKKIQSLSR